MRILGPRLRISHRQAYPQSVNSHPGYCFLCGLRIPNSIVSPTHPLFGTIDHLVPLSRGGRNSADNRYPAHAVCNWRKGAGDHCYRRGKGFQKLVCTLLEKLEGGPVSKKSKDRAILRLMSAWNVYDWLVDRWEDDGGAVIR